MPRLPLHKPITTFSAVSNRAAATELSAAAFFSLVVLGQLATSLLFDHFGWLGFAQHPVSLMRLGGVALLLAGVVLITR